MNVKTYTIGGRNFKLKTTSLGDYKSIRNTLTALNLSALVESKNDKEAALNIGSVIDSLLEKDLLNDALSHILEPDGGETVEEEYYDEITDVTLIDVIKDFFASKKNLMKSIGTSLTGFKPAKSAQ